MRYCANISGDIAVKRIDRTVQESMNLYDNLPTKVKAMLRDNPLNITIPEVKFFVSLNRVKARLEEITRESTLKTYGPNHPSLLYPTKVKEI